MLGREEVDEHVAKEIMKNNVSIITERRSEYILHKWICDI